MKTQNFGAVHDLGPFATRDLVPPAFRHGLGNYKENRLNGVVADSPNPFPGYNLESVTTWTEFDKDFKWEKDPARGYPDKADENRYWFVVIHKATGTRLTGFSQEADYKKGFPDSKGSYWYYAKFHEKECPLIRDWMEERDRNYLKRIQKEDPALYQKELKNHPDHPPVKLFIEEEEEQLQREQVEAERARRDPRSDFMSEPWPAMKKDNNKLDLPSIPYDYLCPITKEIMIDPVIAMDGHTYEREAVENHIEKTRAGTSVHDAAEDKPSPSGKKTTPSQSNRQPTSPMTGEPLPNDTVMPNMLARSMINGFLDQNPAYTRLWPF